MMNLGNVEVNFTGFFFLPQKHLGKLQKALQMTLVDLVLHFL